MGFAEAYCEKVVTTTIDYTSLDVKVTVKKQSATTVRVILDNEHITGIRAGGTFQQWGNGVWENQDDAVANFAQGWMQSGTAWSKDFVFSTYPTTGNFQIYILMDHDAGAPPVAGFTLTSIDIDNECSAPVKTDPALNLNSTAETLDATAPAESFQIVATQSGDGAISYESSNPGIASVDNSGLVTAVGRGTATITVSTAETATYAAASKTLTVTVTGPINWAGIDWLDESNDKYKLSVSPEISDTYGGKHVQGGTDLWIGFPSAAFGAMSITPSGGVDAAWRTFALSNFPNQENQFTVECGGTTYTFDVYFADGTTGGSDPEPTEIYDTNFALTSLGASATSDNGGTANNAIDNNDGSSWESTHGVDAVKLTIDLGQKRIFNTVQIRWEGAYGKAFTIDVSNDGTDWTTVKSVDETLPGPFPYEQTLEFAKTTARYIRFNGIERGLPYGYNMFSFRVLLPGVSTLTSITLNAAAAIAEAGGAGVALTAQPKDQNGQAMAESVLYEITPAGAGHMSGNTFISDQVGAASIRAYNGSVYSDAVTIYAYTGTNVALNKGDADITASGYDDVNNLYPRFAVDDNDGSLWSARVGETGSERVYDAWIVVDLGAYYDINLIAIRWEGACSRHYHVDFSADGSTWRTAYNAGWDAVATHWEYLIGTAEDATKVHFVRVWSTEAVSQYGVKIMDLKVFGTEWIDSGDTEAPVMTSATLVSNTTTSAIIAVAATDEDGEIARYHVVDATNGIDANYVPEAGNITITGLTHATSYNFTITAVDLANHESENNKVVAVNTPFDATLNLALNKTCEGGYYDNNPAESADKVNDGNENSAWVTYANRPAAEEWWYVDLGDVYALSNITTIWGGNQSTKYILQARVNAPATADKANDAAWVTMATVTGAEANGTKSTDLSGIGRYVRFRSIERNGECIRLKELRVFGTGKVAADTEKPVMVSASLVSNSDVQAIIAVSATDNVGLASYHVVDATNSFDANFVVEAGNITVTGLIGGTHYNLAITAVDLFGNESADSKLVEVTTDTHLTEPQTGAPIPSWPADQVNSLYSDTYDFAPASLNSYIMCWWDCPTLEEGNVEGNKYLNYDLYRNGMIGVEFGTISVTLMEKVHIDIWSTASGSVTFRPVTGGDEVRKTLNLVGQQWNSFDINMSDFGSQNWSNLYQYAIEQYQAGGLVGEHICVDNVFFYRTTPPPADLAAPTDVTANVVEQGFASVKISAQANDDSGVVHFKVMNGSAVLVADVETVSGTAVTIPVNGLTPGTAYNLSVIAFDKAGHEAEPVAVATSTLAAPPAAPQPTHDAEYVLSLFSDAYTPVVAATFNKTNWGSAPVALAADYLLYTMTSNVIIFGNNDGNAGKGNIDGLDGHTYADKTGLDVTGMNYIHFDVWCDADNQLNTVNINDVAVAIPTTRTVAGEWVSFDVGITGVALADRQNVRWLKFHPFSTTNCNAAIDNVYFYKAADLVRDDSWMAPGELGTICIPNGAIATGGDIYELVGKNSEGKIVFATVANNQMTPGKPYLFEATSNAMKFYYTAESEAAAPVNTGAMKGTFADITLPDTDLGINDLSDIYYFADHALWSCADISTLSVPANRAYVKLSEVNNIGSSSPAPGRRYITMGVNGKDAATGFDQLNASDAPMKMIIDGQLFILRGEKLYDATGRLVK